MGLSVLWAECNIGANSPEEYGWYFQWGGTIPYNSNRTPVEGGDAIDFGWTNYPLCNGSYGTITKYCINSSNGTVDNKTILEPEDDAAHVLIGSNCRMPTNDEYQELIDACDVTWTFNYNGSGIGGTIFTLKSDHSKTLFFPAAGYLGGSIWYEEGSDGYYWSSSLEDSPIGGITSNYGMEFDFGFDYYRMHPSSRIYGQSVRPVKPI